MKNFIIKLGSILGAIFGVFLLGKKYADKQLEAESNKQTIKDLQDAQKIKDGNRKLGYDDIINGL